LELMHQTLNWLFFCNDDTSMSCHAIN